ncbi:ATP-binding protein [Rhizobium leguminosarum]|uniref:ATP-binding protein n=1 Tax=Rhizobium leguminosarum TaxID=384 RepID=A0A6P0D7W3_RHILE|nr:ATP-binding protein [Rhizobium leguminosarum]MBY5489914.1 ATP-binding protein [Rhizobium leguminosarum]MBY5524759.1 ATP-binding protein [Rhizobium leguminosarum]NEK49089.1 ATP-binding protein [Rhizobium leguminosarum]TBY28582.1 ATP-binding protein [Rhizobium leguminosarum bv. viciae]TBY32735.1 ATP-binding protein [Rhizobium leguminosarum bv. viciae]
MNTKVPAIKPRDRDTVISALRAGVVPRLGLQHIQVGRQREIEALIRDIERVGEGGASIRFVIGAYGAGKTFFLFLVRQIALQRKLAVCQADLSPDRRIHATGGQARSLYAELAQSLSTRTVPDGGALRNILESYIQKASERAVARGISIDAAIKEGLGDIREMTAGYDFATVISAYAKGYEEGNTNLQDAALRWLRGEYTTKTEARADLGVRTIIDDASFYDGLRLLARFVRLAGFGGMLVCLDELVNLYKLQNSQARKQNYEQILRILNDVLQGTTESIGFILGGTPEFLLDTRRGLYSYEALQSRLAENTFAVNGLADYSGTVINLPSLTPEELYHLLERLRDVFAAGDPDRWLVPDDALTAFMDHCANHIGDAYFRTPRNTVKAFVDLLAVIEQNPGTRWQDLLNLVEVNDDNSGAADHEVVTDGVEADDELANFRI